MNVFKKIGVFVGLSGLLLASSTNVDTNYVAKYATKWYAKDYGTQNRNQNYFTNYNYGNNNNCTNFVSQCLISGLNKKLNSKDNLFKTRPWVGSNADNRYWKKRWRLNNSTWKAANEFYYYAKQQEPRKNYVAGGLEMKYITHDTRSRYLNYNKVKIGDIVFADWESDGKIDHSMIVTDFRSWKPGYFKIILTYQGSTDRNRLGNGAGFKKSLGAMNSSRAQFIVYRPIRFIK